jgi:galactose mutarotase-like enzyme
MVTSMDVSFLEIEGHEVVELSNEAVRVAVMPGLGAKIIGLVHVPTGHQWMWKSARQPQYPLVPTGSPFEHGPLVGADECLPTIAPCRWRGLDLVSHGDAWTEAWELDRDALAERRIVTRLRLPISPLWIERQVSLAGPTVRLDYRLRNLSDEPFEYLWAFHPLLVHSPGDRLILPRNCRKVRTDSCLGRWPLGSRGDEWDWPEPMPGVNLARFEPGDDGFAVKLYTEPLDEGMAALHNELTGERLTLRFDPRQLNTLGLWINRGAWNGYQHIAIEPTSAAPDPLDLAVRDWKRFGSLEPGQTRQWWFSIELSRA